MDTNLLDLLDVAINTAANAHFNQRDKAGYPYILHPLAVMDLCDTVEQKIVAVLHDVLEDTAVTYHQLEVLGFPQHVLIAVDLLTRKEGDSYKQFVNKCKNNDLARYVKMRDVMHNLNADRMANLSASKRDYLTKKYKKALADLEYYMV